jgi:FtsH-binding integral membrane protein
MNMAQLDSRYAQVSTVPRSGVVVAVDEGLRAYMLRVYNYMAAGVALTGVVAFLLFSRAVTYEPAAAAQNVRPLARGMYLTNFGAALYTSPVRWVLMLLPLGLVFLLSFRAYKMSVSATQIAFWLFAAAMGASLSTLGLVYAHESIARVVFISAATFGALSLYGYMTRQDLSGLGSFLFMGLIGIVLAGLVNLFLQSSALQFAISVIGVLVFAGLTAYDTQRIKDGYYEVMHDASLAGKSSIMGALNLYLDLINMFVSLLHLFGNRE